MELQVYKNAEFGSVRTTTIGGQPYFVGKDVAEILGYSNTSILSLCLATQDILCVPEQELKSIQIVEVCNKVQYEYGKENKRKKEF